MARQGLRTILLLLGTFRSVFSTPTVWFTQGEAGRTPVLPPTGGSPNSSRHDLPSWLSSKGHLSPKQTMDALHAKYVKNTLTSLSPNGTCTPDNISVRKEWGNLSDKERLEYISAIRCLATLPPKTSPELAPGARSRWDDFVVSHIIRTTQIHWTGFFFAWHREFLWQMEIALRDECGYTGYQPYWDWSKWAYLPPSDNPLFSGNETSLSGDGAPVAHGDTIISTPGGEPPIYFERPPGTGGGCITSGPLVNWTINLGPVTELNGQAGAPNPQPDGLGYNPRCLIRDLLQPVVESTNSYQNVTDLILSNKTIAEFDPGVEFGVHAGGHSFIGGLNFDVYSSPGDPAFFFHHAMVDRVWSIWQSLDFEQRTFVDGLYGTHTVLNGPPSANVTLDDIINLSPAFGNITVRDAMSPTLGNYCYMYD